MHGPHSQIPSIKKRWPTSSGHLVTFAHIDFGNSRMEVRGWKRCKVNQLILIYAQPSNCSAMFSIGSSCRVWIFLIFAGLLAYLIMILWEIQYQTKHKNEAKETEYRECAPARRVDMIPLQDDPWLIQFVRENYILPPNLAKKYNLSKGESNPDQSEGQVNIIKGFFEGQKNGFFVECGASDGEFLSNTLWFEKVLGWNGLLIEADPDVFHRLVQRNRRAWHANVCLSPTPFPGKVNFYRALHGDGGRHGLNMRDAVNIPLIVDCIPLYTLLAAINQTVVDVFSLDIEGAELDVLKTIPFDKITFKVLVIEHWGFSPKDLQVFMNSKGFKLFQILKARHSLDSIYVSESLLPLDFQQLRAK